MNNSIFDTLPAFTKGREAPLYDCGQGVCMAVYNDVTGDEFNDYADCLKKDGFSLLDCNNISECIFLSFAKEQLFLQLYYVPCESTMRIVADPYTSIVNASACTSEKRCSVKLWQFEVDHSLIDCGMCYIFQCSDYSFFVIDSPHFYSVRDDVRIYEFLRARTPENMPVIVSGWFFSHGHVDHIAKFIDILKYNHDIVIEGLYYNFVPNDHFSAGEWMQSDKNHTDCFLHAVSESNIPVYKLHCGQHFYVRDLEINVLCTHEDVYPSSLSNYNDSSTVLMVNVGADKVCFPGDAGGMESDILESRYPEYLSCDIMQAAHHGHFGTSVHFYRLANAHTVLFPTTQIKYDEEYEKIEADRVAAAISSHCYIASNGTVEFTFPLKDSNITVYPDETFEDFSGVYNLWGYEYSEDFKNGLRKKFSENQIKRTEKY